MDFKTDIMHIDCGVQGDLPKNSNHLFWSVFKVSILTPIWKPPSSQNFYLTFTSKQAVWAFLSDILKKYQSPSMWTNLKQICAVGKSTAQLLSEVLPEFFLKNCPPIVYPEHANGLQALLLNVKNIGEDTLFIVLTSLHGKSQQIVDDFQNKCHFQIDVVPLYTLIDSDSEKNETIFNLLLEFNKKPKYKVVLNCRSSQVVKKTVSLLLHLFKIDKAENLPSFIYFSVWENSAECAIRELNLIDRKIS